MKHKREDTLLSLILAVFLTGLLAWALLPAVTAQADLPKRETPTPIPANPEKKDRKESGPKGAYQELQLSAAPAGAWSGVQWQDSSGGWHEVEGWQGPLPQNTRWWVHEKDFGDGPFRWVVTQGQGGPLLGSSAAFNLPAGANETLVVTVSLAGE